MRRGLRAPRDVDRVRPQRLVAAASLRRLRVVAGRRGEQHRRRGVRPRARRGERRDRAGRRPARPRVPTRRGRRARHRARSGPHRRRRLPLSDVSDVQAALEQYRDVREQLERSLLPLATSVDGRRFTFQTSLHALELEAGGYVMLEAGGVSRLGQTLSLELRTQSMTGPGLPEVAIRAGVGEGVVLDGDGLPFRDATARPAAPDEVAAWLERVRPKGAALDVGGLALVDGVPFAL